MLIVSIQLWLQNSIPPCTRSFRNSFRFSIFKRPYSTMARPYLTNFGGIILRTEINISAGSSSHELLFSRCCIKKPILGIYLCPFFWNRTFTANHWKLKWIDENECKKRKEYEDENENWQTKAKSRKQTTHLELIFPVQTRTLHTIRNTYFVTILPSSNWFRPLNL